jgi:hypothetical protein
MLTYEQLRDDPAVRKQFNQFNLQEKKYMFSKMKKPEGLTDKDMPSLQRGLMMKTSEADTQVPLQPGTQTVNDIPMSWSQVPGEALKNLDDSAIEYGKNLWQALRHPIQTGQQLYGLMAGAVEKAIPGGEDKHAEIVDNTVKFFTDRYGGEDFSGVVNSIKKTIATDPVGFLSDLSIVVSGGVGGVAKTAQLGGKLAKVAKIAGSGVKANTVIKTAGKIKSIADKFNILDPAAAVSKGVAKGTSRAIKGFVTERKTNRALNDAMQQSLKVDGDLPTNQDIAKAALERGVTITEKDMIRMARNRNKLGKEIERAIKAIGQKGKDPLFHRDELVVAFDRVLNDTSKFKIEGFNKPKFIKSVEDAKAAFIKSTPERLSIEELANITKGIKFEPESFDKFGAVANSVNQQKKIIISELLKDVFPEAIKGKGKEFSKKFTTKGKKTKLGKFGSPDVKGAIEEFGWEAISKEFGISKDLNELLKKDLTKVRSTPKTGSKGLIVGGASNVAVGVGAGLVGFGMHGIPGAIGYTLAAYYLSKMIESPVQRLQFAKLLAKSRNIRLSAAKKLVDQRIIDYMANLQKGAQQAGRVANVNKDQ